MAAAARLIVAPFGPVVANEAYHAGLLADIGKLAFEVLLHDQDFASEEWTGQPFHRLEKEHFGVDHAMLGAEMARRWQFPPALIDAIAWHHSPSQATVGVTLASAVHIADAAMMTLGVGLGYDGLQYVLDPAACRRMNWKEDNLETLVDQVLPFIEDADLLVRSRR
jgi:putative nucleotidyltransferase with HDIG domain